MRQWLIRIIALMAFLLLISFITIFFRGLFWSPNEVKQEESNIEQGVTKLVHYQNQRLWVTNFSPEQYQKLAKINPFVVSEEGCAVAAKKCLVQSKTNRQGVIVRYIQARPDVLQNDVLWIGGFVDPTTGAIYDLLGRLYRNSVRNQKVANSIHFLK